MPVTEEKNKDHLRAKITDHDLQDIASGGGHVLNFDTSVLKFQHQAVIINKVRINPSTKSIN